VRGIGIAVLATLVFATVPATAGVEKTFPRLRVGIGAEPTRGGGVIAGAEYVTRSSMIAWNRRVNSLTLYLLSRRSVTCSTLRRVAAKPGHLVQVHVTSRPSVAVGTPVADAQVAFITVFRNPKIPTKIAGLREGAKLTFTRVNTYPGGVWHGVFQVPQRVYGDGKVYGYSGTFAAKWCDLRR
jgi:hypothetical protein